MKEEFGVDITGEAPDSSPNFYGSQDSSKVLERSSDCGRIADLTSEITLKRDACKM